MVSRFRPSPALVVAGLALFFAIGGSAFAVVGKTGVAQPRCTTGAVRGIAYVTGDPKKGIANIPEDWQSSALYFGYRFNCGGATVLVKRNGSGFDVRFVGNPATLAMATPSQGSAAGIAVTRNQDGSFHVETAGDAPSTSFPSRQSIPFVIVAI